MFICDRILLKKYEYCIPEENIEDIFEEANKRNFNSLILAERFQKPIKTHLWIKYSKKYNVNLILTKEEHCFSPLSDKKMKFLFVSRNIQEYNVTRRISKILKSQHIPYLNEEAIDYLKRNNHLVWYVKENEVRDYFTHQSIGSSPKIPMSISEASFFKLFDENIVSDYESFFQNQETFIPPIGDWTTENSETNETLLTDEHLEKPLNESDHSRLESELNWLKENNHQKIFWLSKKLLDSGIPVQYNGGFHNFLLSYYLGLITSKPKKLLNLETGVYPEYIFFIDQYYKNTLFVSMQRLLDSINSQFSYPYKRENALFSTILNWFSKNKEQLDIETIVMYKDLYDEINEEDKEEFFENMKLYFLLYPEAEVAFKHAVFLTSKEIHKKWYQTEKIAIFNNGDFEINGDCIDIDIDELKQVFYPMLTIICNKKS